MYELYEKFFLRKACFASKIVHTKQTTEIVKKKRGIYFYIGKLKNLT